MSKGYTLIELVLVLVLIGILAVDAVTRMSVAPIDVAATAKEVAAAVRLAQVDSMTKGSRYCVNLASTYFSLATQNCTQTVAYPGSGQADVALPANMTLTWIGLATNNISFAGNGIPYASATTTSSGAPLATAVTITVQGGGSASTITVAPETGAVTP